MFCGQPGATAGNGASTRDARARHLWVCCSQNSAIAPLGPFLDVVWNSGQCSQCFGTWQVSHRYSHLAASAEAQR